MFNKQIHAFPITYTNIIPRIALGWGAHETVADECRAAGIKKALIVSSGLKGTGIVEQIKSILSHHGIAYDVFDKVTSNPKDTEIMAGYTVFMGGQCDGLVAVGGGSSMDTAKGIRVVAANGGQHITNFVVKLDPPYMETLQKMQPCSVPQISLATTAGTGAEVTSWAAMTDTGARAKVLASGPNIQSTLAIVDPLLVRLQPRHIAAWTSFDAMAHGIEAFVTKVQGPYAYGILLRAIELIYANIREFTFNRMDHEACERMCWASTMGGIGIGFGAGAGIVHGLGHQISALTDCHHGRINAVMCLAGERYNQPAALDKFAAMTQAMGIDTSGMSRLQAADRWFDEITQLLKDLEITPGQLNKQFGLQESDFDHIIRIYANDFCSQGNPKEFDYDEVYAVLKSAL